MSFDYQFYIIFIKEISNLGGGDFLARIIEGFPYFPWADAGKFEFGFASVIYPFSLFLDSAVLFALIASVSIFLKLELLRRFGLGFYRLIIFYFFDVILFESNMLRAGIALSFVLLSCWFYLKRGSVFLAFGCGILAGFFHLSAYVFLVLGGVAFFMRKIGVGRVGIGFVIISSVVVASNLEFIFEVVGGKLSEYLIQAKDFDLYTGASGLNASSFLCFLFAVYFWGGIFRLKSDFRKEILVSAYYAELLSVSVGVLILFSGFLSVVGDRIFQLGFPVLLALLGFFQKNTNNNYKLIGWRFGVFNLSVDFLLFYYVIIGLLFRYPQTNFFSWITGTIEFIPPDIRY